MDGEMELGELCGFIDREMDGGGAGLKAGAGKTREAPEELQRKERKSPGKPCCSFCAQEEDPHFSFSLSSLHAAAS